MDTHRSTPAYEKRAAVGTHDSRCELIEAGPNGICLCSHRWERYEVGYKDGENSAHADWWIALTDHSGFDLPQDVDASDPFQVAEWIAKLFKRVQALETMVHHS